MRIDWLLLAHVMPLFDSPDNVFARTVELTVTYFMQSTLFFALGGIALSRFPFRRRDIHPKPSIAEITWKLAAVLPLLTAPLCVATGWSPSYLRWSPKLNHTLKYNIATGPIDDTKSLRQHDATGLSPQPTHPIAESPVGAINAANTLESRNVESNSRTLVERSGIAPKSGIRLNPLKRGSAQPVLAETAIPEFVKPVQLIGDVVPDAIDESESMTKERAANVVAVETTANVPSNVLKNVVNGTGAALIGWFVFWSFCLCGRYCRLQVLLRRCRPIETDLRSELNRLVPQGTRIRFLRAQVGRASRLKSHSNTSKSLVSESEGPIWNPSKVDDCSIDAIGRRPIRTARHPSINQTSSKKTARQELGIQPFACGLWKGTIVLPEGIEDRLSLAELRALLAHEVGHLIRRDPVWQCLGEFLCTCLAFQPLNFLARRRWQLVAELMSDDWAVDHNVSPTLFASCLTKIAEWRIEQQAGAFRATNVVLPFIGQNGSLTHRIEWLLRTRRSNETKWSGIRTFAAVAACIAGLLIGVFGPRLTLASPAQARQPSDEKKPFGTMRQAIENELADARRELAQLQSRLKPVSDIEINALVDDLLQRLSVVEAEVSK